MMGPRARKLLITGHLTFSVGWIGTVVAYLALGIAASASADAATIRAAWLSMEIIGWFVIIPIAVASFATGVGMALGTKWGLFRHYWVVISFALTFFATVVLILHMPSVSETAEVARTAGVEHLRTLGGDLLHPGIGLGLLLLIQTLNIYKPSGLTRYGWRQQQRAGSLGDKQTVGG